MTTNDPERPFTLNFHYYEQPFENFIFYFLTVESVYTRDQRAFVELDYHAISGDMQADRDPQNIWDPQKDCGSFVDATSSEP